MANGTQTPDVLTDPKFFALPESDQTKILSRVDPKFGSLPDSDKQIILKKRRSDFQLRAPAPAPPKPAASDEDVHWYTGLGTKAVNAVESVLPGHRAGGGAPIDEERNAKAQEEFRLAHAGDNLPPKPASAPAEPVAAHKPVNLPPPTAAERLHVEQPGKTEIGPVNPGFWQRVWNSVAGPTTVAGKVIRGEQGIPLDTPVVDPSALFENMGYNKTTASRIAGGLRDASEFVGGMSSVPNLEVIAASGGAGTIAKGLFGKIAESGVSRLISAGFGAQLLYGLYKSVPEFKKALDSGDEVKARNIAIVGGLSGYFGVKALQHAAGLAGDEASKTPKSEEGGTQGPPAPAAQAQTPTAPPPTPKQPTSPHLDNAVASPEPGRKWSDVLVDKGNLVSSKGGVDHYTVGDRHVIVNEGNVYERPAKAAPRFANSLRKANELKENVPGAHLDNAVGSPSPGEKWSDFLLDKADLVESKDGIDHYKRGGMHYIVEPTGAVHTVKGPEGQRFFDTLARAEKFKAHEDEPTKPPAPAVATESGKAPKPQGGTPTAVPPPASAERRGAPRPAGTPALDLATRHEVRTLMQLDPSITFDEAVQATMDAREAAKNAKPVERVKGLPRPPKPAAGGPPVPAAEAAPEPTAVLHKEPPTLAGVTVDPEQRVVVTDPKAFVNSLSSGAAPPKGTIVIPTASLTLSPKEMQFRSAEGIVARGAATGPIDTWRPDFAKAIDVWFDPADGKVKVVNGHWRTENAQRLGIDTMKADFIEATSVSDARAWGALKNIADKTATPYDAAVFFRETGFTPEDLAKSAIPVEGDIARKGLALSRLSDDVFGRVRNGDLTMQAGAAIGAALPDHDMQRGLADLVQRERDRGKRLSSQEITALADGRVRRSGKTESTTDTLFGPETVSNSNAVEAARLESWVKGQLAKDKKLFGFVADQKRADRLGTAGNKINVDENRKIASEATAAEEAFTRLLYKSGEVDDAILDGAARIARGEDEHAVRENVYGRVKAAVQKALAGDKGASSPVGEGVTRTGEAAAKPGAGVPVSEPGGGANGGGAAAHEPVRGENGGRPEPGNVEPAQRRVAEEPAAGRTSKRWRIGIRSSTRRRTSRSAELWQ